MLAPHTPSFLSLPCSGEDMMWGKYVDGIKICGKIQAWDRVRQVCWAKDGDRVAACFSNKVVSVLDLRM